VAKIYEPGDIVPEDDGCIPNIDLIPGSLRLHFLSGGVTFGMVDHRNENMAMHITYDKARQMMFDAAKPPKKRRKGGA
jgi:hypothetical protein